MDWWFGVKYGVMVRRGRDCGNQGLEDLMNLHQASGYWEDQVLAFCFKEKEVGRRYVTKRIKGKVATGFDKEVEVGVVVSHMVEEMAVVVACTVEEIMGEVEVDWLEAQVVVVVDGHDGLAEELNLAVEEVVSGGMELVGEAVERVREEVVVDCKCSELEVVGAGVDTEREAAVGGNKQAAEVMEQMERS
ncbi:hypothetical protein RJ639_041182 [Escallonia herrerae]|uniref:Uncharacterized protein n=1 Tax=Escallonia herrerae TaxID=1293975 RepID=A0AA88WG38_9ASTE|nr:hypothetical protein RJ639_041182 [Escallonia herrerae]